MHIVLLEPLGIPQTLLDDLVRPLLEAGHTFVAHDRQTQPEVLMERGREADVLMLANLPLPGVVIEACPRLKFLDVAFTGVDHVDLDAARRQGVTVSNAAGYSTQAVAELTLCMMLSLLRHVREVERRLRQGGAKEGLVGCELKGKTVGLVGTGAIGTRVAQLLHAFGCRILAAAPREKEAARPYVTYVPLRQLLEQSDLVSLHCPLNAQTRGLIGAEQLSWMKPTALLINVARGPVVDSSALAQALREGRLAGAGIDVFEGEPPLDPQHPLLQAPHVLATPHVAFASAESMEQRARIVFHNLAQWLQGHPVNVVG